MCLLSFFLLAFSGAAVFLAFAQARRTQRSRFWGVLACLPLLGWLPAILLQLLSPRGGCRKCGLYLEPGPLHCPRCGWELRRDPNPERPLAGREFRIPGWLGVGLLALFQLILAAIVGLMFLAEWKRWKAWEFRVVQARLADDGQLTRELGGPLRFGLPETDARMRKGTYKGSFSVAVEGPRGRARLTGEIESCRVHGWHFPRLEATLAEDGRRLDLSDAHPLARKADRPGGAVPVSPEAQAAGQATLARLTVDPLLKAALGGPVQFPAAPQLRPQGEGRWSLEAPVQGLQGRGIVQGGLVLADTFMAFPRLELRLDDASRLLQEKPEPAPENLPAQVWATLRDYPAQNLGELIVALVLLLLFGGVPAWAVYWKKRHGDELPNDPEAPVAVLARLRSAQREAILAELGQGRRGGLRALELLRQAQPGLTHLEAEVALAELAKERRWRWWPW